jgi:hypothetical protein
MEERSAMREGAEVGLIGASAVAIWFFVVDLIGGRPLYTPNALGTALQSFFGATSPTSMPLTVLMYTIFHVFAFIVVGIIIAGIFRAADREPSILAGFLILFVALELGFFWLTVLIMEGSSIGDIAWYQIGAANLVASIAMGVYLYRRHRATVDRARLSLGGI